MFADLFQIMVHRRRDLHHDASSGRPGDALWKTHGTGHLFSFLDFPSRVKHFLINFEIKMNRILVRQTLQSKHILCLIRIYRYV